MIKTHLPWILLLAACGSSGSAAPNDAATDDAEQPRQDWQDSGIEDDGSVHSIGHEKPGQSIDSDPDAGPELDAGPPDASSSGSDAGPRTYTDGVCMPCTGGMIDTGACKGREDDPICISPCSDTKLRCWEGVCMPWYPVITGTQRLLCENLDGQIRVTGGQDPGTGGFTRGACLIECAP